MSGEKITIWQRLKNIRGAQPSGRYWWLAGGVLFLGLTAFGASGWLGAHYRERIFSGVRVGQLEVGGLTLQEAEVVLDGWQNKLNTDGMVFEAHSQGQTHEVKVYPVIISPADPDLTREVFKFSVVENAQLAYQVGRNGNILQRSWDILTVALKGKKLRPLYSLRAEELEQFLRDSLGDLERPAKNASLGFQNKDIYIYAAENGFGFDYAKAVREADAELANTGQPQVALELKDIKAEVNKEEAQNWLEAIRKAVELGEVSLNFEKQSWKVPVKTWEQWLIFEREDGDVKVAFEQERAVEVLDKIAEKIDRPAKEAKFKMANGKVEEFQAQSTGRSLERVETLKVLRNNIFNKGEKEAEIALVETEAPVSSGNVNELGITELVGVGESNFAGSPKNRRANIAVGAKKINGLLIAPGDEFSTIGNLTPINAVGGYLPELVIKGSRTVPEYGGGLCQIGTTVFRAALDAGLPVTERQEHSYRVVYYEPAGTDATIYDPHPDMRFLNDTGHYLLWQTRIEGDNLIFELWGTKDGREVTVGKPNIFNITSPGPAKMIESPDMAPGEKKCVEMAHKGASTTLKRQVVYPEGSESEDIDEVYSSFYRAWPQVCLVGPGVVTSTIDGVIGTSSMVPVVTSGQDNASSTLNP